jgi:hypothetical protein
MLYMSLGTLAMHSSLNAPFFGGAIAYVALARKLFFGDGAVSPWPNRPENTVALPASPPEFLAFHVTGDHRAFTDLS